MSKRGRSKTNAPAVWVEMPSPFSVEPGHIRLRAPAGGFTREHLDRLRNGSLGQPFILEREDSRVLFFTADAVQSAMSTGDPNELLCTYTRKMMSFLLLVPEPRHVLMIGLGVGSIAKFSHRHLTRTRFTAVEIDAEADERVVIAVEPSSVTARNLGASGVARLSTFIKIGTRTDKEPSLAANPANPDHLVALVERAERHRFSQKLQQDVTSPRSDRHPDSDLACALAHHVGHDAIRPDGREAKRQGREERQQQHERHGEYARPQDTDRGQRQHEGRGQGQTGGGLDLLRRAHERAQAEELDQHEVVDQDGADEDEQVFGHVATEQVGKVLCSLPI